jgi:hypothetical protein
MNKIEVIMNLFNSEEFNLMLSKLIKHDKHLLDDFRQDLFIILMEKPEEKLPLHCPKQMLFYTSRIISNQLHSSSSPFFKTYKQRHYIPPIEEDETPYIDFDVLKFCQENGVLTWYEKEVLSVYYKLGEYKHQDGKVTLRGIEEEYEIDHVSIYKTLKTAREKIKKHLKEKNI